MPSTPGDKTALQGGAQRAEPGHNRVAHPVRRLRARVRMTWASSWAITLGWFAEFLRRATRTAEGC